MITIIKPIKGFPKYLISDKGIVYSLHSNRVLRPDYDKGGYSRITLWKNGKRRTGKVHRLVLEAFVGPCPGDKESCHNDGNPKNNNIDNLRWDTRSNNIIDSVKHKTHPIAKLDKNKVIKIKKMLSNNIKQIVIAKIYNVTQGTISCINTERIWRVLQ